MRSRIPAPSVEMPGLDFDAGCQPSPEPETPGKSVAVECLAAAIDGSQVPRKVLASKCGMSEGNFSKIARAEQGDLFGLVYLLPSPIRKDFVRRLAEVEGADPIELAAEQLTAAALRFLRLRGIPLKAALRTQTKTHCA